MSSKRIAMRERFERFAAEYVVDMNATRAALAAGYAESGAHVQGSLLIRHPKVRQRIDELQSKRASKLGIKAEKVVEELARLAFSNFADYMTVGADGKPALDFSKLTRDQAAAIQEIREDSTGGSGDGERRLVIRTTCKLADKAKALDMLMRHLGAYNDKLKVEGLEGLAETLAKRRQAAT